MKSPDDAEIPARKALPYPGIGCDITLHPSLDAISADRSVLPLLTIMISKVVPQFAIPSFAFAIQLGRVSSSFLHGMTTEISGIVASFTEGSITYEIAGCKLLNRLS